MEVQFYHFLAGWNCWIRSFLKYWDCNWFDRFIPLLLCTAKDGKIKAIGIDEK
jgi:hypothetical protein